MTTTRRLARILAATLLTASLLVAASPAPALAATCNQSSHAWIVSDYGGVPGSFTAPGSAQLTFAAVIQPTYGVIFQYYTTSDQFIYNNFEGYAASNCVLSQRSHQASFIPYVGTMKVYAYYRAWETDTDVFVFLGYFTKTS